MLQLVEKLLLVFSCVCGFFAVIFIAQAIAPPHFDWSTFIKAAVVPIAVPVLWSLFARKRE